jgi:hypothetical protein
MGRRSDCRRPGLIAVRDPVYQLLNDLAVERMRQEEVEGFTPEHDDGQVMAELARMAASYILMAASQSIPEHLPIRQVLHHCAQLMWPVVDMAIKPHSPRRALVIAGALIMAEIERIDRRDGRQTPLDKQISEYERTREALKVRG